jgi:hypothetical protein
VTEQVPEVRVGDRERREVDRRLSEALADGVLTLVEYDERTAACWAARTRSDLEVLTRDLPGPAIPAPPVVPAQHSTAPRRVLAVMSEADLGVPLLPGQPVQATAVMGAAEVDLRREDLPREVHVRATAVMGQVKVHVPPGTTVHLTGGAVMGERKARVGPPLQGGSVVHVTATAVMGTVQVDDAPRKGGLLPRSGHPGSAHQGRGPGRRVVGGVVTAALVAAGLLLGGQVVTADDGVSVFSSREVRVAPDADRVEVGTLFGSIEVVVADDVRVRTAGTLVFGSFECSDACASSGGRELVVEADGGFGSVEVVTESERAADGAQDARDDDQPS